MESSKRQRVECPVCCSTLRKNQSLIQCPVDTCEFATCANCLEQYALSSVQRPHCMQPQCRAEFTSDYLFDKLPKTVFNKLEKHYADTLFTKEKLKLSESQDNAVIIQEMIQVDNDIDTQRGEIYTILQRIKTSIAQFIRRNHYGFLRTGLDYNILITLITYWSNEYAIDNFGPYTHLVKNNNEESYIIIINFLNRFVDALETETETDTDTDTADIEHFWEIPWPYMRESREFIKQMDLFKTLMKSWTMDQRRQFAETVVRMRLKAVTLQNEVIMKAKSFVDKYTWSRLSPMWHNVSMLRVTYRNLQNKALVRDPHNLNNYDNQDNNQDNNQMSKEREVIMTIACANETCRGVVKVYSDEKRESTVQCGLCDTRTCVACRLLVNGSTTHVCDKAEVESVRAQMKTARACPRCAMMIQKASGCSQMYCPLCHCVFDYHTGDISKDAWVHNPHALDYQRRTGHRLLNNQDHNIACGDQVTWHQVVDFVRELVYAYNRYASPFATNTILFPRIRWLMNLSRLDSYSTNHSSIAIQEQFYDMHEWMHTKTPMKATVIEDYALFCEVNRVRYLLNFIDETTWRNEFKHRTKKMQKVDDVKQLIECFFMIVVSRVEPVMREVYGTGYHKTMSEQTLRKALKDMEAINTALHGDINYFNEVSKRLEQKYNMKTPRILLSRIEQDDYMKVQHESK